MASSESLGQSSGDSSGQSLGCFYGVGVGPGDPELLTIKAQRVLQQVDVICFIQLDDGQPSYALSILEGVLPDPPPETLSILIPADDNSVSQETWTEAAVRIGAQLRRGRDVAFITEGDPMLYSEFPNLLECLSPAFPDLTIEVVPGVSSVMAAAARSGVPLVTYGQRLAILPAVYGIDDLREAITNYDTIVLMEIDRNLIQALANLESLGLAGKAIYVRQATTPRERVVDDIRTLSPEDLDYFSLLIIKR